MKISNNQSIIPIAKIISFLSNPILVFLPVPYLLMVKLGYDKLYAAKWTVFSFLFHLLAIIFVLYQVRRRVFSDFDVSKREQRPLLFAVLGLIIIIYLAALKIFGAPPILFAVAWGAVIGVVMAYLINLQIKASMHIAVLTTVLIILAKAYHLPSTVFLLIPVVGWSRITIKRHSLNEVIAGFILGLCLSLVTYIVLEYLHINRL